MRTLDIKIQIVNRPDCTVVYSRHLGPYQDMGSTWKEFMAEIGQLGLPMDECLTICHDDPETTPANEIRSDCCVVVNGELPANLGSLSLASLSGGDHLVGTFTGPYEDLPAAWQQIYGTELAKSGRKESPNPPFEIYRVHDCDHPEKCVTDICIPII